ncbi:MAG: histidinol-phosphate transaminase [Verrucomicrobiales bacterium]
MWQHAHSWLHDLVPYEPGKPIEDVARELGLRTGDIIKLASNENPLGPSPKAVEAMQRAAASAHVYPDGGCYYLREALATKHGLKRENMVIGNGSNEIIELMGHGFLSPGRQVITADHAFVVYKLMATLFGAETVEVADPNFIHDLPAMAQAVTPHTRQLFVANPNNPTGTIVEPAALDALVEAVPEEVILIFDEAYYEFLPKPPDLLKYVREGRPNVMVLRTFSKVQGLAFLRVGYGMAATSLIEVLQRTRQPFNINGMAQAAALAALDDDEHIQKSVSLVTEERAKLEQALAQRELEYVPSHANFVLVKVGDGDAVFKALLQKGVIVRAMRGYKLPEWIRVTVGRPHENQRFLEELDALNLVAACPA